MNSLYPELSDLARKFISEFTKNEKKQASNTLAVSSIVSDVARWYEKLRNAMEYHEEEIIVRATIERILKRRLLFEKKGSVIAPALVKELLWARYFQENTVSEEFVDQIAEKIDVYIQLDANIQKLKIKKKEEIHTFVLQILSADIATLLHPDRENELVATFMFHILKSKITIKNDDEELRDIQTYIALRRSFLKDDKAFLRFNLFKQYFGELKASSVGRISNDFLEGYKEIEKNWDYPLSSRILAYVKKQTPPFLILREVFFQNREHLKELLENEEEFHNKIQETCQRHYREISKKVRRAIIRSVIFLFLTKVAIAIGIEGSIDRYLYGEVSYIPLTINILIPPLLIAAAFLFIRTPGEKNTARIIEIITSVLTDSHASLIRPITIDANEAKGRKLYSLFLFFWFLSAIFMVAGISYVLTQLHMHPLSQILFVFFVATASFLAYRINQYANAYKAYEERQHITSALFDFIFMPFIQLGRRFTEGVSKFNVFLLIFDFLIEMPIKSIFAVSEEWLLFIRYQKEKLD